MSLTQRFEAWLDANVWRFFRGIITANHDYPYHDFIKLDNSAGQETLVGVYLVGSSNVDANGDQSKRFTAKHTNIWVLGDDSPTFQFNDSRNVTLTLPITVALTEEGPCIYQKDFYTNVSAVYYNVPIQTIVYLYFEGVLPQEARDAE